MMSPIRSIFLKEHLFLLRTNCVCADISQSLGLHSGEFNSVLQMTFGKAGLAPFLRPDEFRLLSPQRSRRSVAAAP